MSSDSAAAFAIGIGLAALGILWYTSNLENADKEAILKAAEERHLEPEQVSEAEKRKHKVVELFNSGHYDDSVLQACKLLFDLVRDKSGIKDEDTEKLVNKAFGDKGILKFSMYHNQPHIQSTANGFVHLLRGVAVAFRHPLAHGHVGLGEQEARMQLGIIAYLGEKIENHAVLNEPAQALA